LAPLRGRRCRRPQLARTAVCVIASVAADAASVVSLMFALLFLGSRGCWIVGSAGGSRPRAGRWRPAYRFLQSGQSLLRVKAPRRAGRLSHCRYSKLESTVRNRKRCRHARRRRPVCACNQSPMARDSGLL
jgi:hypothetical protein